MKLCCENFPLIFKGKVKADLKHDACTLTSDVDLNLGGPMVNASAVIGHKGWLAGYQMAFDSSKSKLTKNNFGIGYATKDFVLHTNVNDGQVTDAFIMHWRNLIEPVIHRSSGAACISVSTVS